MASANFLSEFAPVSSAEWESAIRQSVAGPEYPAKLNWRAENGLVLKACYRAEDLKDLKFVKAAPGEFPFVRGTRKTGGWRIREEIVASDPTEANRLAIEAVAAGSEEISFRGVSIEREGDLALLLADLEQTPLRFEGLNVATARLLADWLRARPHAAGVSADIDPFEDLALSAELCSMSAGSHLFTLSAQEYEERGAGSIEQVAFLLAAAVEYIDALVERGFGIDRANGMLGFSFATGPHFLLEIAKLRAFRLAWARVVESFGGSCEDAKPKIYARTARWNETVYDPHLNVLRATTEAMSAILGGAESIAVAPFDECYREPDQGSRRLARNVQLILKHEAEFARVADPLGGAYVIEALTKTISTKAWKMFQELEAAGGYRKAKSDGIIDSVLDRESARRNELASHRRIVLTGTNRYADASDKALGRLDSSRRSHVQRTSRCFEEMRFRTERAALKGELPKILLAEFGDAKFRVMRAQFVAEFLACAGLEAKTRRLQNPLEVAQVDADLIVLCSSDAEYLPFAKELMPLLALRNKGAQVAIAGQPECMDQLKQAGVAEFIYTGCDAVEVLNRVQQRIGIEG